jgi:flavorubredoxin
MPTREIKENVFAVGAVDWDRRLFDELIPLPDGTSYNSYLIRGKEKTALIDTVDPTKTADLIRHLRDLRVTGIDYIISHHAEQDHSGAIPDILDMYPEARVVTNEKCKSLLVDLLPIAEDRFLTVGEGSVLRLGGKTLEFIMAPWVHWPETMLTYLAEDRILFSCDFLGAHLAQSDPILSDEPRGYKAAKRYYAEIMMPFRAQIRKHLDRLQKTAIDMIAPSHGAVYPRPEFILQAYRDWTSDRVVNKALIPFVSMHGSTRRMVEHLCEGLTAGGIEAIPFNMIRTDIGEFALEMVDAATLVIGSSMVLTGAHPAMVLAVYLANALRPKTKFASIIGSYGWGGRMMENLQGMLTNIKAEILEPVFIKGHPREADFQALDRLADAIRGKHRDIGIL